MNRKRIVFLVLFLAVFFVFVLFIANRNNDKSLMTLTSPIKNSTVIIDPGHGGPDGGAVGIDGTIEKDINLSIALKLRDVLDLCGINTLMTRETDVSIHDSGIEGIRRQKISDIKNRFNLIEGTENAVYVSIHQNHFSSQKYKGTQVFYSPNNPESKRFAQVLQEDFISFIQPQNIRQCKKSGTEIYLLYHARCPAVMIECGFLSNPEETQMLKSDEYQNKLSIVAADGIVKFLTLSAEVL